MGKRANPSEVRARAQAALAQMRGVRANLDPDPVDAYLIVTHTHLDVRTQANTLGLSYSGVLKRRGKLLRAGALRAVDRAVCAPITPHEVVSVRRLIESGLSLDAVAAALSLAEGRVQRILYCYLDGQVTRAKVFSAEAVARLFGSRALIAYALRRELLTETRPPGRPFHHAFTMADLIEFTRRRELWMAYAPSHIRHPELRRAAELARLAVPGRWVSYKDLSLALGVSTRALSEYAHSGMFAGYERVSYGHQWFVWIPAGWDLPTPKPKDGRHVSTPARCRPARAALASA